MRRTFPQQKNKKGLTPVIAVILLLMMTVAAAGAAFFWFVRIQSEMQGGTESYSEELTKTISSRVQVATIDYSTTTDNLTLVLQNVGSKPVSIAGSTTTFILRDYDQNIVCNVKLNASNETDDTNSEQIYCPTCNGDLAIKSSKTVVFDLTNKTQNQCYIANDTTYAQDTTFYFKLDFGATTGTGGSFTK
jgi:flagellin-like protein